MGDGLESSWDGLLLDAGIKADRLSGGATASTNTSVVYMACQSAASHGSTRHKTETAGNLWKMHMLISAREGGDEVNDSSYGNHGCLPVEPWGM